MVEGEVCGDRSSFADYIQLYSSRRQNQLFDKIIGASLDFFKVSGGYPENIVLSGTTVVQAEIECIGLLLPGPLSLKECGFQVRKLLRQLPSLKYLDISDVLMVSSRSPIPGCFVCTSET